MNIEFTAAQMEDAQSHIVEGLQAARAADATVWYDFNADNGAAIRVTFIPQLVTPIEVYEDRVMIGDQPMSVWEASVMMATFLARNEAPSAPAAPARSNKIINIARALVSVLG